MFIRNFFLLLMVIVFSSCNSNKNAITDSQTTELVLDSLGSPKLKLTHYPEEFIEAYELEEWKDFEKLYESMERLKELNFDGIEVDLIALSSRIKELRSGPLPRKLEVPQIKSRIKVVEMQVQKARYFTKHYKKDSLIPSLILLYEYFNGFVSRMESLENEDQEFENIKNKE